MRFIGIFISINAIIINITQVEKIETKLDVLIDMHRADSQRISFQQSPCTPEGNNGNKTMSKLPSHLHDDLQHTPEDETNSTAMQRRLSDPRNSRRKQLFSAKSFSRLTLYENDVLKEEVETESPHKKQLLSPSIHLESPSPTSQSENGLEETQLDHSKQYTQQKSPLQQQKQHLKTRKRPSPLNIPLNEEGYRPRLSVPYYLNRNHDAKPNDVQSNDGT